MNLPLLSGLRSDDGGAHPIAVYVAGSRGFPGFEWKAVPMPIITRTRMVRGIFFIAVLSEVHRKDNDNMFDGQKKCF
jgi:hypothetical protein